MTAHGKCEDCKVTYDLYPTRDLDGWTRLVCEDCLPVSV